jgi:DNA-binding PadR family transcriptional regulator
MMAKKNTLEYILLGLLAKDEQTGYDLKKSFEEEIGEFWQASHSQIYPELKKLEDRGFIESRHGIVGSKLEKTYYSLTLQGRDKLRQWIVSATPELAATKDEFILKLYFVRGAQADTLEKMFEEQIAIHEKKIKHLKSRMEIIFPTEEEKNENIGHFLILDHAIDREEGYLLWLGRQYRHIVRLWSEKKDE